MRIFYQTVVCCALLAACGTTASQNVAKTSIHWGKDTNGNYSFSYDNGKDIQGLKAKAQIEPSTGAIIGFEIELENSNTPAAAMSNAAKAQEATANALTEGFKMAAPIITGAIKGGLLGGGPGAGVGAATGAAGAVAEKLAEEKAAQGGANATSGQTAPAPATR